MEADPGDTTVPAVTHTVPTTKEWMNATVATLDHTKDRANKLTFTLRALEQQQADSLAAQKAERKRQALQAAAAEKKRREALAAEQEKRFRELQVEELKRGQMVLSQAKGAERAGLLAATANFKKMRQAEGDAKEKERVMKALNDTSQLVLAGVLECQHLMSKLWGSLMLCDKRQRLREGRPQAELFKDHADQALQLEWQLLTASREELNVLVTKGEALRSELEVLHIQLNSEQSREKTMHRVTKSNSAPVLSSGQEPQAISSKDILKKAITVIDEAAELPRQSTSIRVKVNSQCDLAMSDVHTSLDRRKADLGRLISGLQEQKEDAEKTIGDAQRRIVKLRRRAHNTMETPRSSKASDDQLSSAESLLVDLKSLKDTLETDLSNKYHALKIDESCRQLTKTRTGGHKSKMGQTMRKTARDGGFMHKTARDGMMPHMPPAG